jgi:hypothetical protein
MATQRKLFKVSMLIDHSILHELLSLADGKSFEVDVQPVKHGGTDENGALQSMPSGAEFVAMYAQKHPHFKTRDCIAAAVELGVSKGTVVNAIYKFRNDGIIKSVGVAEWKVTARAGKKLNAEAKAVQKNLRDNTKAARASSREKSHPGGTRTSDKIMGVLVANKGTADINLIKEKLGAAGNGVSPTLTAMIAHKEIVRVEPGVYRVNG